ncbi:hypothetical protein JRQ81_011012 [Phrynocephalus forsythii]|uniref:aspartate transaminase n=1 Tax=Phrynocephalus forsythii TaxID=171643 RepID=A0A9Q1AQY1_9SAUR|nr:hypothetical protein JRQ81_011012 [Phrynocephalus forsythii]
MDSFSSSPGSGSSFLSLEDKSASVIWGCELNDRTRKCVVEEDDDLLEHFICLRTMLPTFGIVFKAYEMLKQWLSFQFPRPTTDTGVPLDVYRADPSPRKVCLGHAGCLTDRVDEVWIPPVVQRILLQIPQDPTLDHEYLPELGMTEFTRAAMELIIGKNSHALLENRAGGIHTVGGPAAVWIAAEFLQRWYKPTTSNPATIYIAVPQLGDIGCIFQVAGFTDIRSYHYWDPIKLAVDTEGFLEEMQNAPESSIVFLHAPEEMGLAPQGWEKVAAVMQKRHLFPFFEIEAQGLASGNLDKDAWAVRYFVDNGFELLCAQSFSKIFGLYDDRVGNLVVVTKDNETLIRIQSQVAKLIAVSWFCPTNLGGRVIAMVLTCPALRYEW